MDDCRWSRSVHHSQTTGKTARALQSASNRQQSSSPLQPSLTVRVNQPSVITFILVHESDTCHSVDHCAKSLRTMTAGQVLITQASHRTPSQPAMVSLQPSGPLGGHRVTLPPLSNGANRPNSDILKCLGDPAVLALAGRVVLNVYVFHPASGTQNQPKTC